MKRMLMGLMAALVVCTLGVSTTRAQDNAKLKDALAMMKEKAAALGAAKAEGAVLFFGTTKINDTAEIVDAVKAKFGCAGTFFVKEGDKFIRVSTNVQKEGKAAVGTALDAAGPVYPVVSKGETFTGEADVLGTKYDAVYEPIKNDKGEIVGAYFVGVTK